MTHSNLEERQKKSLLYKLTPIIIGCLPGSIAFTIPLFVYWNYLLYCNVLPDLRMPGSDRSSDYRVLISIVVSAIAVSAGIRFYFEARRQQEEFEEGP